MAGFFRNVIATYVQAITGGAFSYIMFRDDVPAPILASGNMAGITDTGRITLPLAGIVNPNTKRVLVDVIHTMGETVTPRRLTSQLFRTGGAGGDQHVTSSTATHQARHSFYVQIGWTPGATQQFDYQFLTDVADGDTSWVIKLVAEIL